MTLTFKHGMSEITTFCFNYIEKMKWLPECGQQRTSSLRGLEKNGTSFWDYTKGLNRKLHQIQDFESTTEPLHMRQCMTCYGDVIEKR